MTTKPLIYYGEMNVIEWIKQGNIFESGCQALVNPVNCRGKMGKGLALEFKHRYPEMFESYQTACHFGDINIGYVLPYLDRKTNIWIVNFPTKDHWINSSKLEWIDSGLRDLRHWIYYKQISSIAVPALGCGNGGLDWFDVANLISNYFGDFDSINVKIYEPKE